MKYCIQCLQPDTRPKIAFNKDGVCPACEYFETLKSVDWQERVEIIQQLIKQHRNENQIHDCIMGVSGGKDSTRQAIFAREKLKLNPLLVCCTYPPDQISETGVDNVSNLIELGFDVLISAPAPQTWKKLKIAGFDKFTNSFRSTEMAIFCSVFQAALYQGIGLILWGENPGLQLGEKSVLGKEGYDGNNFRRGNTISSGHAWMEEYVESRHELFPYILPTKELMEQQKIDFVYLGWLLGDWSLLNNGAYAAVEGFDPRDDTPDNTGDATGVSAIDEEHTPVNQLIKYLKFGFGKTTEFVSEEIRMNRMTREEGIAIVEKYDGVVNRDRILKYCEYLKIDEEYFWQKVHLVVNKDLFYLDNNKNIIKKFKVGYGTK